MAQVVKPSRFKPEQTAIHRSKPSPFAKELVKKISLDQTILDYGCGYGEDVNFYHKCDLQAEAYDPYKPFGWSKKPTGHYDIVVVMYVLNVLPTTKERIAVLKEASSHLLPTGRLIVVTRTAKEINTAAQKHGWESYSDGFWSERNHATFQHGLDKSEILALGSKLGLVEKNSYLLTSKPSYTLVEFGLTPS